MPQVRHTKGRSGHQGQNKGPETDSLQSRDKAREEEIVRRSSNRVRQQRHSEVSRDRERKSRLIRGVVAESRE
jgi:hypothetical protein